MIDRNRSIMRSMRVDDVDPVELEKHLAPDLLAPHDAGAVEHGEMARDDRSVLRHLRRDGLHVGAPARGEQLDDLDAHRLAQRAEQLRVDDRRQLMGGALTAPGRRRRSGTERFISMGSIYAHTCIRQGEIHCARFSDPTFCPESSRFNDAQSVGKTRTWKVSRVGFEPTTST